MPETKGEVLGVGYLRFLYHGKHICLVNKRNLPTRMKCRLVDQKVAIMAVPLNKKFEQKKLGPLLFRKKSIGE